ncbi:MAG: glycerol-3-phosphate 1-O-acyltransferase PlsY [Verrucomicrobiaceae bacterium]|nr:glycerol-3-phosphate 1-O-acyltransferase PlsY [Verrucomicrobiaceae bacterium]
MDAVIGAVAGFLSGSLPFGYFAGRMRGMDIREHGSGNIGATNVIRVLGKGIGIPVFVLDLLKGLVPVLMMKGLGAESWVWVLTGMCAILGHMFTPWLGFKGGKGVATAAGVLLGIEPLSMLVGLGVWLGFYFGTRYVSLASMMAGVGVAGTMAVQMGRSGQWDGVLLGFGVVLALLVILRHRANIGRLIAGTEPRSGGKKMKVAGGKGDA